MNDKELLEELSTLTDRKDIIDHLSERFGFSWVWYLGGLFVIEAMYEAELNEKGHYYYNHSTNEFVNSNLDKLTIKDILKEMKRFGRLKHYQ